MPGLSLKSTWICYARTIAQGNSPDAHAARLCLRIGGTGPTTCQRILEHDLALGRIDDSSYRARMEAIERVHAMHRAGIQTHEIGTTIGHGWETLGEGSHRRMIKRGVTA